MIWFKILQQQTYLFINQLFFPLTYSIISFPSIHINLLMLAQSNQKLQPHRPNHTIKMPAINQRSPTRLAQLLNRIQYTRSTFRNLLSNCVRKLPRSEGRVWSRDILGSENNIEKIQNSVYADTTENPSGLVEKATQQMSDGDIRTQKKFIRLDDKDSSSPKSSPTIYGKKADELFELEKLPAPKQKFMVIAGSSKKKDTQSLQIEPIRKSYLDFNPRNFQKGNNETFVRIQSRTTQRTKQNRVQQTQTKLNEAVIKTITKPVNQTTKLVPIKPSELCSIDNQTVRRYVKQNSFLEESATAATIFEYFNNMIFSMRVNFQQPLIKKYKNCVYFGENPATSPAQYQGILYHYKTKIYFGSFKQSKKHGQGCEINFKQGTYCKGEYQEGRKVGKFKVKTNDYQYDGQVHEGLFEGKGILANRFSKYIGQFLKGYKHGQGQQQFFQNGQSYTGNYLQGKFDGTGKIIGRNYYYQGQFKGNLKHGQGYQKTIKDQYRGSFAYGKRDGPGILKTPNGDCYTGHFKDGQIQGKGQCQYSDGKKVCGYFINGRILSESSLFQLRSRRKNNLLDVTENQNDEDSQIMNFAETKKDWNRQINTRQSPRDLAFRSTSKTPFNPEKLLRLVKADQISNYTPQPLSSRLQCDRSNSFNWRGLETDRTRPIQSRGGGVQRYYSNQSKKGQEPGITYSNQPISRPSNNIMQLDYSLLDNSVDEEPPSFPTIPGNKFRNKDTQGPTQKHF